MRQNQRKPQLFLSDLKKYEQFAVDNIFRFIDQLFYKQNMSFMRAAPIIMAVLFILIAEIMNHAWRRSLFYQGVMLIKQLQGRVSDPWMVTFQNLISMLCSSKTMYGLFTLVFLISRRKITCMVFLLFFIANGYLNSLQKMLFMDPRPFWTSSSVRQFQWHCPMDFGNPSGHSRSSAYFYFLLFYDLLVRDVGPVVWLWLCLLISFLTPLSRMYLGAHSANQVSLGLLIGFAFLVIYKYGLQAKIYDLFNSLIRRKSLGSLLIICFIYLVCFLLPLISYQYKIQNPNTHLTLQGLMISCPKAKGISGLTILTHNFIKCSVVSVIFGMLIAVWASEFKAYRYYYGQWRYSISYLPGKIIRILAELVPAMLAFYLFANFLTKSVQNAYLKYISSSIAYWCVGFLVFYGTRPILLVLNIIEERRENEPIIQKHLDCC